MTVTAGTGRGATGDEPGEIAGPRSEPAARPAGGFAGRILARVTERLGVSGRELACLGAILVVAAVLRFVNLPLRGGWDSDQGTEMLALQSALATGQLPIFGPEAISVSSSFHHGALYYDLLLPAAWLGNGDPTWVVGEIALLSLVVVPAVWWIARSIGGAAAGLAAAFLAAVSASLIGYATFIWNPTLVEPGAAVAFLGAWQALRTGRSAWWIVAAVGSAVAVQSHIAAAVIVAPMAFAFAVDLRRGPAVRRRRVAMWGLAGVGLVAVTYLPFLIHEIGHDFADTRGMLAYFSDPNSTSSLNPLERVLVATIRMLGWPLTRWPLVERQTASAAALLTAASVVVGLSWRLAATTRPATARPATAEAAWPAAAAWPAEREHAAAVERLGVRLVGAWLLLLILALGLGLHAVSEIQELPTEQYHVVADALVFVAAGLIVGGLWRPLPRRLWTVARRVAVVVAFGALLTWNVGHMPPLTSPDGGWAAAQAAATRLEHDAGDSAMALVPLYEPKGGDAYIYPLARDGFSLVAPDRAETVILLCDTFWLSGCGDQAEKNWLASDPAGHGLTRIDQFAAAPDRILTVYSRDP